MKKLAVMVFCAAAALAGCGGGGDDTPATERYPTSANDSIGNFIAYLQELVVSKDDTLSPVDVSGVVAPTDETSSPVAVN